eukprot:763020-Hanusia_phi.AAC.10
MQAGGQESRARGREKVGVRVAVGGHVTILRRTRTRTRTSASVSLRLEQRGEINKEGCGGNTMGSASGQGR